MKTISVRNILVLCTILFVGCHDSTSPEDLPPVRFVAGADASDTVLSQLSQALVVEVNDGGSPLSGAVVRFQSVSVEPPGTWGEMSAYVAPPDRDDFGDFLADTTDENGRAFALVQLGTRAGDARIVVTVPDLGMEDTAHFTVLPGNAYAVIAEPSDTAIFIGESFVPRGRIVDKLNNPIDSSLSYRAVGSAVTFADGVVKGVHGGSSRLIASYESLADTAIVGVVPEATFAAIDRGAVVTMKTNGTGYQVLVPASLSRSPYTTDWTASGDEVVFDHTGSDPGPIEAVNMAGDVRAVSDATQWGLYPEVSPDGSWVYYARGTGGWALYRVHTDGSGEEKVPVNTPASDVAPSLAPDGKRLVYVVAGPDALELLDLTTGASTDMHTGGHTPAWSPKGNLIAYVVPFGGLYVVAPDGSGIRRIGDAGSSYDLGIDWSPDGQWIIARNNSYNRLELIDVESGTAFPIPATSGFRGPSWKP